MAEHRRNRRETNFEDPELNAAIEESLKELGVANDPATRRQIMESQRQGKKVETRGNTKVESDRILYNLILSDSAQHDLNMRMDEDEALQEAIKRSLNC